MRARRSASVLALAAVPLQTAPEGLGFVLGGTPESEPQTPEVEATFQILFPPSVGAAFGFDGFGGMVVKPWEQREAKASSWRCGRSLG